MNFVLLITIFSAVIAFLASFFILLQNHKKADHFYFAILSLLIGAYSVFNYFAVSATSSSTAFLWAKLILFISIPQGMLLLFFAATVKSKQVIFNPKLQSIFLLWMVGCWVLTFNDLIFSGVSIKDGVVSVVPGKFIPLFVLVHIGSIIVGSKQLFTQYRNSRGREKKQLRFVTLGLLSSYLLTFLITLVLPFVFESTILLSISPIFLSISIIFTAYAIIAHKLFDIRAALARSVGFLVVTIIITAAFASSIYVATRILLGSNFNFSQLYISIVLAMMLAFVFPYVKTQIEKLTARIFYQDRYDPQALIATLNRTLVSSAELEELLTKVSLILQENLKATYCTFFIRETSYFPERIIGAHRKQPEFSDLEQIQEFSAKSHVRIITTTDEYDTIELQQVSKLLKKNEVEVMARIVNTLDYDIKGLGLLFLGPKKNGTLYSSQDLKMLEIVANELVIAIEGILRFEEIEQFNVTLQKKIDDATKELQASNQKLRALDEAKDEFVSMASHQLRTPLTSIKGYLSMVLEGDAGKINDTQRDMLGQAFFSSQRMVYLISDLLNVSRLKTGKFIIEPKPVYLPDLVEDEVNQLQDGAKAKDLTLVFTKPKQFSTLNLDDMKIRQVVMNFTDNAIYYTPSGGKITVALKETPKSVEFTVTDSGIGVPKDQQPKLFTKFYRADNARKARPDGTGLGLFMAKKVIIAQGGSIIFASKVGKGSTFGFSFPKEKLLIPTEKA